MCEQLLLYHVLCLQVAYKTWCKTNSRPVSCPVPHTTGAWTTNLHALPPFCCLWIIKSLSKSMHGLHSVASLFALSLNACDCEMTDGNTAYLRFCNVFRRRHCCAASHKRVHGWLHTCVLVACVINSGSIQCVCVLYETINSSFRFSRAYRCQQRRESLWTVSTRSCWTFAMFIVCEWR